MNHKKPETDTTKDIAIVGMACRFPDANNYKEFWDNLANGRNSIREITPDRWDINQFYSADINEPNKSVSKWGGLLNDIDTFDNRFFNISPQEADAMDPQQRLLLEETWHCIEDSGIALHELQRKKTAVYVGVMATDYQRLFGSEHLTGRYDCLGNFECILSNRLSHFFNFTGDSESIDAACASSLVSIHYARRSLLNGESDYAIAAGVSVICHPWKYISFSKARMLSATGQCRTFDAAADGYVPGEGVGVLLLQPLEQAIAQRHQIYGVLKGSAVKHTGKSISITAPRVKIERQVVEQALKNAGVDSQTITYVEAHGTGTSLGDPIEVEALTQAFHTQNKQYCTIGAVKTNIGHLEAAAGVAGVIKVLLMFKHHKIPPTLNITTVNPIIDFERSPFRLANQLTEWQLPKEIAQRRAGVSSFGFGGINAHVILEEHNLLSRPEKVVETLNAYPFFLSANTAESLKELLNQWQSYVKTDDFAKQSLGDICYTLVHGREVFSHRFGLLAKNKTELVNASTPHDTNSLPKNRFIVLKLKPLSKLVYSSFHELCQHYPVTKRLEHQCLNLITDLNKENLPKKTKDFIVLYILGKVLLRVGLKVQCIMGEGVGEIAAAAISGMIDLKTALSCVDGISNTVTLARPHISFYSSQQKKIIAPYQITEQYCQALATTANIDNTAGEKIIDKCSQLLANQFTFKKYIADWEKELSHHNIKIEQILQPKKSLTKETRLLLLIVLISCINNINKKWHLENRDVINNESVNEILDLLDDNVLTKNNFIELILTKNNEKYAEIAKHLNKNQHKLAHLKPYLLLKKYSQKSVELSLQDNNKACDSRLPDIENQFMIEIGGQKTSAAENILEDASDINLSLPEFLLDLWCKDVLINWRLWFSSDNYDLVALPGYQFTKEHHWVTEKQDNKVVLPTVHEQPQLQLIDQVRDKVVEILATITKSDKIDPSVNLSQFGIDSVAMTEFTMALDEHYGIELTPAILFEHNTLNSFIDYLIEKYPAELAEKHKSDIPKQQPQIEKSAPLIQPIQADATVPHDIAIIGMSGLFPGSEDVDKFWENMLERKDMITEIPKARWNWESYQTKTKVNHGGFVDSMDQFDPLFFNISPREAEFMDPQQRKFIETVWKAIENAGYSQEDISAIKTGLFVGVATDDYAGLLAKANLNAAQIPTGVFHCMLANRSSYLLNLSGPSETIDTACSSSLVAIHHAVHAILDGDCEIAIAGGVNALLSPDTFLEFSQAGMLSEDGHCKTFDKSSNGYVRSEGAGVVILKSLQKALADKDTIYGVIKGTAVNHGGHVSSLTVPNPNAQADVIMLACERAHIGIDTINYIETHGTGTPVGDPIEINGLKKAFQTLRDKHGITALPKNYCGLGSVKSSVGHLEGAAGIAGVIKVLLAMKYGKLPGTVHFTELNPYIDIKDSPFYIVDKTREWTKLKDKNNQAIPLRAGISSFGFGGANAHVIIEEAPQQSGIDNQRTDKSRYLVTLSARTEIALKQKMADLTHFLLQAKQKLALEDISYTLNAGRTHFEERCAMVVSSINELVETLKKISQGEETENSFTSLVKNKKVKNKILDNLLALANSYVDGFNLDWEKLHHGELKHRIPLPSYPFAKERYWFSSEQQQNIPSHPLIDQYLPGASEQQFKKQLVGNEFYLDDHRVQSTPVLPGVAYLEMARAAGEMREHVVSLRNIVWAQPIRFVDKAIDLTLTLRPEKSGANFVVATSAEIKSVVHAQGKIEYAGDHQPEKNSHIDLKALINRINKKLEITEIYSNFKKIGLEYGKSFQVIQELFCNETEAISQIQLPTHLASKQMHDFILHPSLLDGVLQTTIGLLQNNNNLYLPFGIGRLDIFSKLPNICYAYVKKVGDNNNSPKFDIQITDETGETVAQIKDFTLRLLISDIAYYTPTWVKSPITATDINNEINAILVIDKDNDLINLLRKKLPEENIIHATDVTSPVELCCQLIDLTKNILNNKLKDKINILCVSTDNNDKHKLFIEALSGFSKAITIEHPKIYFRSLCMQNITEESVNALVQEFSQSDISVRYDNENIRWVKKYNKIIPNKNLPTDLIHPRGVYLITGGAGGLGLIFASYLAKNFQAKLILTGRSVLNEKQKSSLSALEKLGAEVLYIQSNITKKEQVIELIKTINNRFGSLNGILHCAGLIRDAFAIKKSTTEMAEVLAPKIDGTLYLDECTQTQSLDFFILFSSIVAVLGNLGQTDYAYANSFMDAFAAYRDTLRAQHLRQGKSLAINWPLWSEGGMQVDAASLKMMDMRLGMKPLSTDQGIEAFKFALTCEAPQIIVAKGNTEKIEKNLEIQHVTDDVSQLVTELSALCSRLLKIKEIDPNAVLSDMGLDSIVMIEMLSSIEETYHIILEGNTLLEYRTIQSLAKYLASLKMPTTEPAKIKTHTQTSNSEKIAVIGMAGRFPGSPTVEEFWNNLYQGRELITEIPKNRWPINQYYSPDKAAPHKSYSKWGGHIENIEWFDANFFEIAEADATMMDPPQRILLEVTQELLDRAGYTQEELDGKKVSVMLGAGESDYQNYYAANVKSDWRKHRVVNHIQNMQAARIAKFYNLLGPAFTIDTACSSSLVAIHEACKSLLSGESDMVIAGGAEILIGPAFQIDFSKAGVLSDDGKCYAFDERAKGMVLGEGVGLVLLKKYEQALTDGDQILGVVLGSAINNDGKTSGLTVPNLESQKKVIEMAVATSGITPDTIGYYEAHGTGTLLGDPIEVKAMNEIYRHHTNKINYCGIGSVKSNMGHALRAAGIASFVKVLLAIQNKIIPPTINCQKPHPRFRFAESPFYPVTEPTPWVEINNIRRAAIAAFGFGGTNCHLIMEEYNGPKGKRKPLPITSMQRQYYWLGCDASEIAGMTKMTKKRD